MPHDRPSRRRTSLALTLTLVVTTGLLRTGIAGDTGADATRLRVHRLAQNVERAESVRAVKRLQETYAQYSQFGLWSEMTALFADDAQLSYGAGSARGRRRLR